MTRATLTRFAPAPTGLLHLGHVVNAIYVWGLGARYGARVLLRVEDHDAQRARRAFETHLLDDLDWLGFAPDVYPTHAFRSGSCESRQSDRHDLYASVAARLVERGLVYACTCSRQDVARHHAAQGAISTAYPGTCRDLGRPLTGGVTWRVRIDPGTETFIDLLGGPATQDTAHDHGDVAIRDRHGNWTYTFAVTVDDFHQGIDLVIRGSDLHEATGGQIRLARTIGRPVPPRFAHHAVLMKSPTQKLSKADGDTGLRVLREAGWTPSRVIGHAAFLAGLVSDDEPIPAADVAALFPGRPLVE